MLDSDRAITQISDHMDSSASADAILLPPCLLNTPATVPTPTSFPLASQPSRTSFRALCIPPWPSIAFPTLHTIPTHPYRPLTPPALAYFVLNAPGIFHMPLYQFSSYFAIWSSPHRVSGLRDPPGRSLGAQLFYYRLLVVSMVSAKFYGVPFGFDRFMDISITFTSSCSLISRVSCLMADSSYQLHLFFLSMVALCSCNDLEFSLIFPVAFELPFSLYILVLILPEMTSSQVPLSVHSF